MLITGAVLSITVMVWLHVALLPQGSAACHVRVTEKLLPQPTFVTVLTTVIVALQVSVAVGTSKLQEDPS
jgi:hypothetical protein